MKQKISKEYLTFDDVLIKPAYSEITPLDTSLKTRLTKNVLLDVPFVSSAMDTVTEYDMAKCMAQFGGIGFLHHNMSTKKQIVIIKKLNKEKLMVGITIGVNDSKKLPNILEQCKPTVIILDNSHAHTKKMAESIKLCKKHKLDVIVGNIATAKAAAFLIKAGADALKVGIGSGSICTTRIITGVGIPQLDAIKEVYNVSKKYNIPIIADGGIRTPADVCKAIVAGAESVIFGSVLAGTKESPGEIIYKDNKKFKTYRGMGSKEAMKFGSSERYNQAYLNESDLVEEGVNVIIHYKGSVIPILKKFEGGLRNSLAYVGSKNISQYKNKAKFVKISKSGLVESLPHIKNLI